MDPPTALEGFRQYCPIPTHEGAGCTAAYHAAVASTLYSSLYELRESLHHDP